MATAIPLDPIDPPIDINDPAQDQPADRLSLPDILTAGINLADHLTAQELTAIGQKVIRDVEIDERSRGRGGSSAAPDEAGWLWRYKKWLDMAMQVRQAKNFPWAGACYSLDTDILTDAGWRPIGDVEVGEKVLSRAPDGSAAFHAVTQTFRHHAPWLVEFKGKGIDLRVTPNHKMLVENKAGDKQELIEASEFLEGRFGLTARYIPLTSTCEGERPATIYGIDAKAYARFLGWFISEGSSVYARNTYTTVKGEDRDYGLTTSSFSIAQSKSANPEKYQQVIADIEACGFTYKAYDRAITVHARSLPALLAAELRSLGKVYDKHIPAHVMNLAPELLEQMLETLVAGDGHTRRRAGRIDGVGYFTTSHRLADQVQEIAQKLGRRATLTVREARAGGVINGRQIMGAAECYTVNILNKARVQVSKLLRRPVRHDDDVACVAVEPHHTVYVRRNGVPVWCGNSNVKFPLLTTASIQFQARAYPAIVNGSNLVKGRVMGPDENGDKQARADRIGQHMTWQLLYRMPGWEEETDRLLLMLPITGCVFRKTYFDSITNANCSEMVSGEDFIINYWAKSLETAPRYTHVLRYYPYEVMEKVAAKMWKAVRVESNEEDERSNASDDDTLVEFYEQHRPIDLDGDGYPEPYVVTTTKEGEVARIVPCFGPDEITVTNLRTGKPAKLTELAKQQDWDAVGDVIRIERRQYFTKYGFIPAPDGSFYDIGFGALLEDLTASIDSTINQMLDAGALQNAQGGFVGSGVNMKGGELRFRLGEWKRVDVTAGMLRDNIFPLNMQGPSQVLFNLLGMLIESAKEITSVQDVMTGEGTANQPATTTLALIEQGHKVMTAIFKRIHRSFGQELRILRRLNRDYLDEEEYFQLNDGGQPQVDEQGQTVPTPPVRVGREDYEDADLDVIPVSDPTMASDMQKMARAQALMALKGDPTVNQQEITKRYLEALGERDIKTLMAVPPQGPNPAVLVEGAKLQVSKQDSDTKSLTARANAADSLADAASKLAGIGLVDDAAAIAGAATELGSMNDDAANAGGIPGMEGQPPDAGIPPVPEGPPVGPDGGMGQGPGGVEPAGDPGAGPAAGGVGGDQLG